MVRDYKSILIWTTTCCFKQDKGPQELTVKEEQKSSSPLESGINAPTSSAQNELDRSRHNRVTYKATGQINIESGYTTLHPVSTLDEPSLKVNIGPSSANTHEEVTITQPNYEQGKSLATSPTYRSSLDYSRLSRKNKNKAHEISQIKPKQDLLTACNIEQSERALPLNNKSEEHKPPLPVPFRLSPSANLLRRTNDQATVLIGGVKVNVEKTSIQPKKAMLPPARNNKLSKPEINSGIEFSRGYSSRRSKKKESAPRKIGIAADQPIAEAPSGQASCRITSDYYELEINYDNRDSVHTGTDDILKRKNVLYAALTKPDMPNLKETSYSSEYDDNLKINADIQGMYWYCEVISGYITQFFYS